MASTVVTAHPCDLPCDHTIEAPDSTSCEAVQHTTAATTLTTLSNGLGDNPKDNERMLSSVKYYCSEIFSAVSKGTRPNDVLVASDSAESAQLWSNTELCIYLCQIQDTIQAASQRIFKTFEEIPALVQPTLLHGQFDVLWRLFTTLSPTNTKACPAVRDNLLSLITYHASNLMGPSHPLVVICDALLEDGESFEASQRALEVMHATSVQYLGATHTVSIRLAESIQRTTKFAEQPDEAVMRAEAAFMVAKLDHGPDSAQARAAEAEVARFMKVAG